MSEKIIIDAKNGVLGRVASLAAKEALKGKQVIVVNCNEAIVAGSKQNIIKEYSRLLRKGGSSLKGPKVPRIPERFMKRTIRGMLPHFQARGEEALQRVMCYNEVPKDYEAGRKVSVVKTLSTNSITLKELMRLI
ncbi:MAG: 50S ribosomal protein L13 [Candidatus Pacearchaeota archaeon]